MARDHSVGGLGRAVVGADHVQAQVETRRDTRGGQHLAAVDVQHGRVDRRAGEGPRESVREAPVGVGAGSEAVHSRRVR